MTHRPTETPAVRDATADPGYLPDLLALRRPHDSPRFEELAGLYDFRSGAERAPA